MTDPREIWLPAHGPQDTPQTLERDPDPASILSGDGEPILFTGTMAGRRVLATLYAAQDKGETARRAYCAVPVSEDDLADLVRGRIALIDVYRQDLSWIVLETRIGNALTTETWAMVSPPDAILARPGYRVIALREVA